jgi:hypothetical protein
MKSTLFLLILILFCSFVMGLNTTTINSSIDKELYITFSDTQYNNSNVTVKEGDYTKTAQLQIETPSKLDQKPQSLDLSNPLIQIIITLIILSAIIIISLLLIKKNELKAKYAPNEKDIPLKQTTQKEKLLAELKEEFKKD